MVGTQHWGITWELIEVLFLGNPPQHTLTQNLWGWSSAALVLTSPPEVTCTSKLETCCPILLPLQTPEGIWVCYPQSTLSVILQHPRLGIIDIFAFDRLVPNMPGTFVPMVARFGTMLLLLHLR